MCEFFLAAEARGGGLWGVELLVMVFLGAKELKRISLHLPLTFVVVVVMQETAVPNLTQDWSQNRALAKAGPRETQNPKQNPGFTTEAVSTSRFLIKLKTIKLFITLHSLNPL